MKNDSFEPNKLVREWFVHELDWSVCRSSQELIQLFWTSLELTTHEIYPNRAQACGGCDWGEITIHLFPVRVNAAICKLNGSGFRSYALAIFSCTTLILLLDTANVSYNSILIYYYEHTQCKQFYHLLWFGILLFFPTAGDKPEVRTVTENSLLTCWKIRWKMMYFGIVFIDVDTILVVSSCKMFKC